MTNTTKEVSDNLEQKTDVFAKNKTLGSSEAESYLDEYHSKTIDYFKQANDIADNTDSDNLNQHPVAPMNFKERYDYMIKRKYHFIGYRQMKTFKTELVRMNVSYQTRLKSKQVQTSLIIP